MSAEPFELPESALPRCIVGNHPAKPSHRMLYEITGFERDRSAGGTNHVIARQRTGRVVCDEHALMVQDGRVGQEALL